MKHTLMTNNGYLAQITIPKFPSIQPQSNLKTLCQCARLTVQSIQELQRSYDADMERNRRSIESLQKEVCLAQLGKDELSKQIMEIKQKNEEEVSLLKRRHIDLQKTIATLQVRHSTLLKTKIESAKEERNSQQLANLAKVEAALKDSENSKHLLLIALDTAKREAEAQASQHGTLRNQNDTLKKEKEAIQEERDNLEEERNRYGMLNEDLRAQQEAYRQRLYEQQEEYSEIINNLELSCTSLRRELDVQRNNGQNLTAKQEVWQRELQGGLVHISELQKSVRRLNGQLGNLSQQLEEKTGLIQAGVAKEQQLQSQCTSKQVQVGQLQLKCEAQRLEMDKLRRQSAQLSRVYEVTVEHKVDGADRIAQLEAKVGQLEEQKWKIEENCLRKTNEWDSSRKECVRLAGVVKSLQNYIKNKEKSLGWILNREVQRDIEMHETHEKGRGIYEVQHIRVKEPNDEYLEYTGE